MAQIPKEQYDYLIIGGGVVAGHAAEGIREIDQTGSIGILSADRDEPYTRPALSKKIWRDSEFTQEDLSFDTAEKTGAVVLLDTIVTAIDRENRTVQLQDGSSVGYKKLLLATGGEPAVIDGPEDEHVIAFRSQEDYRRLRIFSGSDKQVLIVGGSYIGTELAASLTETDTNVTLIYPQERLMGDSFPEELSQEYEKSFKEAGVELVPGKKAESYTTEDGKLVLQLDDGTTLEGDTLVLGLGVTPRTSLAEEAGLEVEEGVVADENLRTSDPDIFVAGDIVSYPDPILGRNRIEHVDHARKSGTTAGKNMAGAEEPYDYTPYFYSVVFSISWKAIGKMDSSLDTLIDEVDDGKVVYYLEDNKPVGVLAWNIEPDLDEIRELLKNPPSNPNELKGKIRSTE
ncbi:NAD(P)/FAD-dependent oxidoreductase [Atopococcus tabaci]|uniref:NAD(P)/FAD-dependent oxidoreductase n=1 Tax=Atopococcus tabaci TaxID=269774 RepID=UPI002409867B|nr:FAD-dependent oxidoreductase [Atopococcus tabaci]